MTLIHSNNSLQIPESKYLRNNNGIRFSLSSIDNVNLELVNTKPIYMNRRKWINMMELKERLLLD